MGEHATSPTLPRPTLAYGAPAAERQWVRVASTGAARHVAAVGRDLWRGKWRYLVLTFLSVLFLLPFAWMVGTSLTPADEVLNRNRPLFPPDPAWGNYREALTVLPFHTFLKNTLLVSLLCTVGQTLSAACVAFAFARLRFPGREPLFLLVLSTMMLPPQVTMIPTFILFTIPGWIDSLKPLIVPSFFGGGAFFIFLLRQFFLTIPLELEEAARLDGCSTFGVFRHVVLPNSKPALTTVALFSFIGHWNDFLGPLIYTQSMENKTLAVGLSAFKSLHGNEYHLLMAASVAVLVPILVIFFFSQRYFVDGIVTTGVKG
jgi:ABC-type glycerol-3-phosphate transport system permease component